MKKLLLLLPIFITTLFITQSAYADVEDYVYVWDWDTHPAYVLCGSDSVRSCSDYSYVIFEPTGSCSDNAASFYVSGVGSFTGNSLISACSKIIAPVDTTFLSLTSGQYLAQRYSGDITITLTDDIASCDCPEPEPCPDCDEPAIVRLFKDGFWGVATALVALIVPILALFLVFRLVHDFFWGRG